MGAIHSCKSTCFKKETNICRFGFPQSISEVTKILGDNEIFKNNGKFCLLKRGSDELFVNNYNPSILKLWQANMDIQPVGSMFGVAYYIAKYCSKEEDISIRNCIKQAINEIKNASNNNLSNRIYKACKLLMNQRERSAQEAAYVLCGFNLKRSSRSCVFINTRPSQMRTRMLKKEHLYKTEFEDENFCSDIFHKYENRPLTLENICLYEFASTYRIVSNKSSKYFEDDQSDNNFSDSETENVLTLLNYKSVILKKRKKLL